MVLEFLALVGGASAQTSSTGALVGVALDGSNAGIPFARVVVENLALLETRTTLTDTAGRFVLPLLPPALYRVNVLKNGYYQAHPIQVSIRVTESLRLSITLLIEGATEHVNVLAIPSLVESDSIALGRVVDTRAVLSLPLATRNFTQIVNLSPGVLSGVNNAGELGMGSGGLAQIDATQAGIFVHGSRSYDNGYQFDGIPVTDLQASGIASAGIPIPNPDSIEEFKVQTGLYDASFGQHAGASVSLVTKTGTNDLHASIFEYFRNDALNANDFFRKRAGQSRPVLKQNQFGLTVGGPIRHDRLYYFGSYQGTRQTNGVASGQTRVACSATFFTPPLTDDRSAEALGALFGGMSGASGGIAIRSDGSNINPVALDLLNFKLPNGSFLIPNPQTVDPSQPISSQGLTTLTHPCSFREDQILANADATLSPSSRLSLRWMWSDGQMQVFFPGNGLNGTGNIPGFSSNINTQFRVLSAAYVRSFGERLVNESRFGYTNTLGSTSSTAPFRWSDLGVVAGSMNNEDGLPSLAVVGSINLASAFPRTFAQKQFYFSDMLSYSRSRHWIQLGGSVSRFHDDIDIVGIGSLVEFLSWPDFLLGLDAKQNGTNLFSNIFASIDDYGLLNRRYRSWNGSLFVGDRYRASHALTVDVGLRFERIGQFGDELGRNSSFDVTRADPSPPFTGSVSGYVVAANYSGPLPSGVIRASNDFANLGRGQNGFAPRIGFAWQPLMHSNRLVLRGGYGIFFSAPTGQAFFQSVFGAPFSLGRLRIGNANAAASFNRPFAEPFPTSDFFPYFPPYSSTSNVTITTVSPKFRPALIQQFGLSIQFEVAQNWLIEVGYVGSRGIYLLRSRSLNQALSASTQHPIRGATTNAVENIGLRVPVEGVPPDALTVVESAGDSWYNGLEASVTKRFGKGLEMLGSYTFSKALDSDGSNINGSSAGNTITLGDQNSPSQRWGRASFDRTHRLILSGTYDLPSPSGRLAKMLFGNWSTATVLTLQSGTALTIAYTNGTNVFGISEDRAQLAKGCDASNIIRPGSLEKKLKGYFNTNCFTTPAIIGADGIGTSFGNSGTGIADGPGQFNIDVGIMRTIRIGWPREGTNIQVRAEFFNALNHAQFSNPNTIFGSSSFGIISSTSVSPRVGQLALRLSF